MEKIKVLIPTDFSVQAEYAFILVDKMSQKAKMEIHFLHVMNMPDTVTMDSKGNISTCGEIDVNYVHSQRDIALRKLEQLKKLYGEDKQTHLVLGKTNQAILDFAENNHFDLIAMGTKGAWGLKEKLSGTETQLIARKSKVPVLSLMCDRSDLEIQNILLVHQFEVDSIHDLTLMKKIITAFQPKIHLLEIANSSDISVDTIYFNMDKFAAKHELINVEKHVINDKDVENGVIHFNQMNNMDLVCIGTHGKGNTFFHSSATEKLINHMFKPIISFQLN
jgi:nucleotide-binding universal stress UspA family protein